MVTDTLKLKYRAPRGEVAKKSRREETDKEPESPRALSQSRWNNKGTGTNGLIHSARHFR